MMVYWLYCYTNLAKFIQDNLLFNASVDRNQLEEMYK